MWLPFWGGPSDLDPVPSLFGLCYLLWYFWSEKVLTQGEQIVEKGIWGSFQLIVFGSIEGGSTIALHPGKRTVFEMPNLH